MGIFVTKIPIASPDEFLSATSPARLAVIKDILTRLEKEEISRADIKTFIYEIIKKKHEAGKREDLEKQAHIAAYAEDQSASLKMVLEYLALSI